MNSINVTPWMKGTLAKGVCRGNVHFFRGDKVNVHFVPAKYDGNGNLIRCSGYEAYVGKVHHAKNGKDYLVTRFLYLDEVDAVDINGKKHLAKDFSTSNGYLAENP